jgi:amino acid transporter
LSASTSANEGADAAQLRKLGYAQQLLREMGGFSNFALSFSIISILTGAVTLYGDGLRNGGPFEMSVGWPLVTVMTMSVAMSLAQLASAYPTAGALYHWSVFLGGKGWGFLTAWCNTVGQLAVTAGVDFGLATFLVDMLGLSHARSTLLAVYAALLVSHGVLNHLGVRAVRWLNSLSAWYHLAATLLLVILLAVLAPKHPLSFLAVRSTVLPHGYLYGFLIGLLQAQWTFTGYDASAHATEETVDPTRNAPWGIVLSVAVSGVFGYALLLGVTLSMGDLESTIAAENPFIAALEHGLGPVLGRAMVWAAMGAMWFCGLASVTSNSRMLFAFARDGGLPGSSALARVSPRFQSPHVAVWISVVFAFALALWADAYSAMVALSTIALYASYGLPILVGLMARKRGRWVRRGPWDLGSLSTFVNVLALAWIAVVTVLFVLPPNQLAGYTFVGLLVLLAVAWFGFGVRNRFRGPPSIAE